MSARIPIREWWTQVRNELLPKAHGHQVNALAELSFAMVLAENCQAGKISTLAPGRALPASVERRLERVLANDRLDPESIWPQLARSTLDGFAGGPIILILDETPNRNDLRCMRITLAYRKRALPLFCVCYDLGGQPKPMPDLIVGLLEKAAACLPEGSSVTLLADRGLAWPRIVDACQKLGWHYAIRLQRQTKVRAADGRECTAADLAPKPGTSWHGEAEVFKKSGWRTAAVTAYWPPGRDDPWLVLSDRDDGPRILRRYGKRTWTEELFKDEKSGGFHWNQSHVKDPSHAGRLMVVIALATYLALALGSRVVKAGLRHWLDPGVGRTLSLFQLGLRMLRFSQFHDRPLPSNLSPVPS